MISKKGVISLFASCDNLESIQIYISPQFLCFVRLIDWLHNISPVQLWHRRWWPSPTPPLGSNAGEMWQILGWTLSELKKENFNCWTKSWKHWNQRWSRETWNAVCMWIEFEAWLTALLWVTRHRPGMCLFMELSSFSLMPRWPSEISSSYLDARSSLPAITPCLSIKEETRVSQMRKKTVSQMRRENQH